MATWIPAPSVPVQAAGRDSPLSGRYPYGEALGQTIQQAPSPSWIPAPATSAGNDGTDVFSTG